MKEEQARTPKLIIVLGTNGTGKTTLAKKLVCNELKKKESHVLIVTPDDMEWGSIPWVHPSFKHRIRTYVGVRKIIYEKGLLGNIWENFRSGLLIFDDCRSYFRAKTDDELLTVLIRRRQLMSDIIVIGHGFTQTPPAFFTFATHFALFKTIDNIDRRKDEIQNFEVMKQAQQRINEKAIKDPHYFEIIKV